MDAEKKADGKRDAAGIGAFRDSATDEERALARALDACGVPPLPRGAVLSIHLRAQAEEAARRRVWRAACAVAAAAALLLGAWGAMRRDGGAVLAEAGTGTADGTEAAEYAQEEADWLSPYDDEFEALETTLLAFESMDFATEDSAFPSL